jgi:hypothetical protein
VIIVSAADPAQAVELVASVPDKQHAAAALRDAAYAGGSGGTSSVSSITLTELFLLSPLCGFAGPYVGTDNITVVVVIFKKEAQ